MKNILMVLAIAAAMGISAISMAQDAATKPAKKGAGLRGKITKIDGANITVTARDGTETVVVTDDSTKVTIDGADSKVADLKEGLRVTVTPTTGTATLIVARSGAGKGKAPPATAPAPAAN